jgi:hypothetical protein
MTIEQLATSDPDLTPLTFPSSSNKISSISLFNIKVPPLMAHILEKPSGIPALYKYTKKINIFFYNYINHKVDYFIKIYIILF